jgi:iron(III) transport system permease protein
MRHPAAIAFVVAVAALVAAPIVSLVRIALGGDNDIWAHIAAYVLPVALLDTMLLLAGVAAITAIVGVGTAWVVTAFEFPGRNALVWLLPLPLAFPTYIVAYVYVDVFEALGPVQNALRALTGSDMTWFPNVRSLGGAIFVMSFVLYPYVYLAARAMFQTQSTVLIEMARTLGASGWRLARYITLPLARPAIAAGLSLALLETLNDIGASEYLGVRTLTLSIFTTWLNRGSLPGAAQIAGVMLLAIAALIAIERLARRGQKYLGTDQNTRFTHRIRLAGAKRWAALAACVAPVTLGFLLPLAFLVHEVIVRGLLVGFESELVRHTVTTVTLAGAATALTLLLGFGTAIAVRLAHGRLAAVGIALAGLGYAVPGTVLALGLLSPLVAVDEAINAITTAVAGVQVGLVLAGSGAAIVIAYVIRFLAVAIGFGQAALARISPDLDDAARTLGARPAGVVRFVHLPLSRPALWGAALLVFVDCLKELPATLLLRPLNVETLSTYIYQFATRGSFEEGALAALLIVAVGILPVMRMVRYADEAVHPKTAAALEWSAPSVAPAN